VVPTARPSLLLVAVALTAPLAALPAAGTPVAAGPPWWCAPDAVLSSAALPDALPASGCALDGRTVVGARGAAVAVPPVGRGVTATASFVDGAETVSVWTDEYGVHVRGDRYAAALGYLDVMRNGTAPAADLARMALATRRVVTASVGLGMSSTLLDAADTLVAAYGGEDVPAVDVATARETVAAHLAAVAAAPDGAPSLASLRAMADDLRAVVAAGTADRATFERALTEAVSLGTFLGDERDAVADRSAVDPLRDAVSGLTRALRAAIGIASTDTAQLEDPFGAALADLSEYLATESGSDEGPGVPVAEPDVADPTGLTGTTTTSPQPCDDSARTALFADHAHWTRGKTIPWYYNNSGRFPAYSAEVYAAVAREAFDNITTLHDDCGYSWRPHIYNRYVGWATQTAPAFDGNECTATNDGKNIVGWHTINDGMLAYSCVWRGTSSIIGADVILGRQFRWDIAEYDPSFGYPKCDSQAPEYDYESALTHEFGHVAGLGHVAENGHAHLTMSTTLQPCERGPRTPGYGDAIGLGSLYTRVY
jgi:hypothetical protein